MVVSTVVENNKTVRTWQESRGKKTLTRRFVIRYRVNALCNGKHYTIAMCDTEREAGHVIVTTKRKVDAKYAPKFWVNESRRTSLTHHKDNFISAFGAKKSISLYITEEGANETISEVVE